MLSAAVFVSMSMCVCVCVYVCGGLPKYDTCRPNHTSSGQVEVMTSSLLCADRVCRCIIILLVWERLFGFTPGLSGSW